MEAILQLDGAKTVQQITSLEVTLPSSSKATPSSSTATPNSSLVNRTDIHSESDQVNSQTESDSVRNQSSTDQTISGSLTSISNPDLDLLASQTAGVADMKPSNDKGTDGEGVVKDVVEKSMNAEEILAMKTLLSKQLVNELVSLLAEIPLL